MEINRREKNKKKKKKKERKPIAFNETILKSKSKLSESEIKQIDKNCLVN